MSTIAFILFLLSFILLILGMIKPRLAFMGGRKKVFFIYSGLLLLFMIIGVATFEESPERIEQKKVIAAAETLIKNGEYQQALAKAEESKTLVDNSYAQDLMDKVTNLINSEEAYKAGIGLLEKKDYTAAAKKFSEVLEGDVKNYPKAQEQLQGIQQAVTDTFIANIIELMNNDDFYGASELIEEAITYNDADSDLYIIKSINNLLLTDADNGYLAEWVEITKTITDPATLDPEAVDDTINKNKQAIDILEDTEKILKADLKQLEKILEAEPDRGEAQQLMTIVTPTLDMLDSLIGFHDNSISIQKTLEDLEEITQDLEGVYESFDSQGFFDDLVEEYYVDEMDEAMAESTNLDELSSNVDKTMIKTAVLTFASDLLFDTNEEEEQKLQDKLMKKSEKIDELINETYAQMETISTQSDALGQHMTKESLMGIIMNLGNGVVPVAETVTEDTNKSSDEAKSSSDSANEMTNFQVEPKEIKAVADAALKTGKLGPFHVDLVDQEISKVIEKYGEPDYVYEAQCTSCDDISYVQYGDFGLDVPVSTVSTIWLQIDLSVDQVEQLLGKPDEIMEGMFTTMEYYGDYTVSVNLDGERAFAIVVY